jgi:hypothetical protein
MALFTTMSPSTQSNRPYKVSGSYLDKRGKRTKINETISLQSDDTMRTISARIKDQLRREKGVKRPIALDISLKPKMDSRSTTINPNSIVTYEHKETNGPDGNTSEERFQKTSNYFMDNTGLRKNVLYTSRRRTLGKKGNKKGGKKGSRKTKSKRRM